MNNLASEKVLIYRARQLREGSAFSELVKANQAPLRRFLFRLCRNYHRADDIAQDTFIMAWEKLSTFKGSGTFAGWLFKIGYNCFLQQQRKIVREQQVNKEYEDLSKINIVRYDAATDAQLDLEKAMLHLNDSEAAAITLCHTQGFSHSEVAEILDAPLGTVKSNIKRGKEKLKTVLMENSTRAQHDTTLTEGVEFADRVNIL